MRLKFLGHLGHWNRWPVEALEGVLGFAGSLGCFLVPLGVLFAGALVPLLLPLLLGLESWRTIGPLTPTVTV